MVCKFCVLKKTLFKFYVNSKLPSILIANAQRLTDPYLPLPTDFSASSELIGIFGFEIIDAKPVPDEADPAPAADGP